MTPSGSEFMVFSTNEKLMTIVGVAKYYIFLDSFKIVSGLKNYPGYVFWLQKLKNYIITALKPTGIKLEANPIKIYHAVYIFEKKDVTL